MAAAIPLIATVAGTVLSASAQKQQADQQYQDSKIQAAQVATQAKNTMAQSQIQAMEDRRQASLAQSRALAVSAASGASSTSASTVKNISDIAQQGELNALTSLWGGNEQARNMNLQSDLLNQQAKSVKKAAPLQMIGSVLQSGSSLYSRYGGSTSSRG
ncbi:hypothetical protein PMPD1_3080 [Paramixta manurensis]|uniref:Internal virion protein n=1 Tax=Paramixta manurensis TaxID=2740817 RepID=A0A6M8USG4_9GAMM|nr:hypothetical protein PMPD1_3080 [Erwiniaceae bacterium PD-1]